MMSLRVLVAFCFSVACLTKGCNARKLTRSEEPFDHYMLVRQWPRSFCDTHGDKCVVALPDSERFTIHGLWPNWGSQSSNPHPNGCDQRNQFDINEIKSDLELYSKLKTEWISLTSSASSKFWAHEWNAHGTCAEKNFDSQADFFRKVVELHEQYNLENVLAAVNITPSENDEFSVRDILDALENEFGAKVHLHCASTGSDDVQLFEVGICFTPDFIIDDCPQQETQACQNDEYIYFRPNSGSGGRSKGTKSRQQQHDSHDSVTVKGTHIEAAF